MHRPIGGLTTNKAWNAKTVLITDNNLGGIAHRKLSKACSNVDWISWEYPDEETRTEALRFLQQGSWELGVSFYSDLILPRSALSSIRLPINIHPALPIIRGVGHDVIPLIQKHKSVGVTIHRMEAMTDAGAIYHVIERTLPPIETYHSIRARNQNNCLDALDWLISMMCKQGGIDALEQSLNNRAEKRMRQWGSRYYSRQEIALFKSLWAK
jgi:methionyl-tRNA formyltransferase